MKNEPVKTRKTKQRAEILRALIEAGCHPTAEELCELVRKELPHLSLATVYRNLEVLAAEGSIIRLKTPTPQWRFDANPVAHAHVTCRLCGKVDDIRGRSRESLVDVYWDEIDSDFTVEKVSVDFFGVCSGCRRKQPCSM